MNLVDHIADQLRQAGLGPTDRLAVAYSGGPDSTALLLLASMALGPSRLLAIHIDHGVRPASAADLAHCARAAEHLGVRFRARRLSSRETEALTGRHGPEAALRKLRYRTVVDMCREEGIGWVATGHTADDVIETHLLSMLRGSGLTGLAGPRGRRRLDPDIWVVRPLLDRTRTELLAYLEDQLGAGGASPTGSPLRPLEDETNRDTRYARNRLRHQVVPVLVELAGGIEPLLRSVEMLRTDRAHLEQLLAEGLERLGVDVIGHIGPFGSPEPASETDRCLDLSAVEDLERPEVTAVLRAFVAHHAGGHPPSRQLVTRLRRWLTEPGRTRWVDAPGCRLRVAAGRVVVEPPSRATVEHSGDPREGAPAQKLRVGGAVRSPELGITVLAEVVSETPTAGIPRGSDEVVFDLSRLGEDATEGLALRGARPGDRFSPFGMEGSVRLFRWLAGLGVARSSRPDVPVVTCKESIIWVVGRRRGDQAVVTEESRELLRLRVVG